MAEENFRANHLLESELDYELSLRGMTTTRIVADKRKILGRVLAKEKDHPGSLISLNNYDFDIKIEKEEIEKTFSSIDEAIVDFIDSGGNIQDHAFQRIKSRIICVTKRVQRLLSFINIPNKVEDEDKDNLISLHNEFLATCLKLEADLYNNSASTTSQNEILVATQPVNNVPPTVVYCSSNNHVVSDLNIKFNGDSKSLHCFLERITEFAHSRNISNEQLFNSAVELFTGDAFCWYQSIKGLVNNWQEIVDLLKRDFFNADIDEDIWEEIKKRKQKHNESIAIFIAHMQTLFNRLSRPPVESSRVKYVRKNMLPEYIGQLALTDIGTMQDLSSLVRKLEEAKRLQKQNAHFTDSKHHSNNVKNFRKQENLNSYSVNEVKHQQSYNPHKKSSTNNNVANNCSINNVSSPSSSKKSIANSSCWNCGGTNHRFSGCLAKRKLFCFKCGLENVKANSCPNCSKN